MSAINDCVPDLEFLSFIFLSVKAVVDSFKIYLIAPLSAKLLDFSFGSAGVYKDLENIRFFCYLFTSISWLYD